MSKIIHVSPNANKTYQVQVELPSHSDRKAAGQFLDDQRLQVELQQHGCTPEQIEQGFSRMKNEPGGSIDIVVEEAR
ncbi:MAG: hypothetical protein JO182_15180 [Acidobacteriaceae bacterium]|nr:hypothetical protein [Acidobacteriaceae bacterium]